MLTPLGKIAVFCILAGIFAFILISCSGCTLLPALDHAVGSLIPDPPTTATGEPITDTKQYIFSGLVTLALGAIAIYVHNVKKNGATKKDLEDLRKDPAANI